MEKLVDMTKVKEYFREKNFRCGKDVEEKINLVFKQTLDEAIKRALENRCETIYARNFWGSLKCIK